MKSKKLWTDLSVLNLCVVAFLGMTLRSKILFDLPFIDYNNLLEAHHHFAFSGWATMALLTLMVFELLPGSCSSRRVYTFIMAGVFLCSWAMAFTYYLFGDSTLSASVSTLFIFFTFFFAWRFSKDIRKAGVSKTVLLLSISSVTCLVLSSIGPFMLSYLFAVKSLNAIYYRDALFTYLHLQYNGFFTLAVFALLFHKLDKTITDKVKRSIHRFSVLLCISVLPSLFLSFLWQDPNNVLRVVAVAGSGLVLLALAWFIISAVSLFDVFREEPPLLKFVVFLSMSAFVLKMFLQSFTIFPVVGNAVFGDRPMIIGFLHLVFLGFVSLFILAWFSENGVLNIKKRITGIALVVFALAVVINEALLLSQGLGAMFFKSSSMMTWLLWEASIGLFAGAVLLATSHFKYSTSSQ